MPAMALVIHAVRACSCVFRREAGKGWVYHREFKVAATDQEHTQAFEVRQFVASAARAQHRRA